MNNVQLIGRLTREVDLKQTTSGTAVGTFTLAVNRSYTNQQGEREADFINCVIWRQAAENLARFTRKGSQIGIDGRIQTRNYENQQGQRVYVTEVIVNNFYLIESRAQTEQRPATGGDASYGGGFNNNYQSNQQSNNYQQTQYNSSFGSDNQSNPFSDFNGGPIDISEDDLPF